VSASSMSVGRQVLVATCYPSCITIARAAWTLLTSPSCAITLNVPWPISSRLCARGVQARRIWQNDFVGTPCRARIGHFAVLNDVGQGPHRLRDRRCAHRAGPFGAVSSRLPVAGRRSPSFPLNVI